ncbi:MAG: glycosyl hydrolase 108 family protein, partial [Cetobacterium sp.]|uniref:glycosyl hydrolase 108 family protein n=1 Tax=Cetobacterium sp. TaxID=2071632 RepID=UPI003F2C6D20
AAARSANTKRDLILDSIESAPLRFGASLIGGIIENTTDVVELAKMTGVNAISGGIGGAFGFAVDMGLGAWDNYMTANLESRVLYERDATQQERIFRAGVGAAAQLGMTATSKMIGKAVEGWNTHKGAMVEEANIRRSEALASLDPNVKAEVEPEITINVDPIAIAKAQTDAAYGIDGMSDTLAKNNTLEVGGTVKFDVENQPILPTSDENFVKFISNYNNKDIEVTMPREIQTNPNMTSLEVQNLRAAKSTVTFEQATKIDGTEVVETKNITGHNKRDAVLYATTTQPKMKNVINTVVPKAEAAGRINEKAYIEAYESGLITGDMTPTQKLRKLDSQLSPTVEMDLKHTITDPLEKAYDSAEWEMTYKIGQALNGESYGEFVFTRNTEGTLSKSFVTGDSTRVSSTTYDPFNQSMMRTHEILFANRAKADIIDSMLIDNKYSNLIEMTPDGEVRLRSNTGTILDQGEVGLIDLYVNRNNAGVDVTNEYSRLGITEQGDVVEIINGFANTDRLNATAINEVIDKVLPEEYKLGTRGLLEEVGILKRGEEGEFIATKEDLLNGFMELENRLMESTDKEPIERALKLLYDKDNSPFKIRDKDGNVISGMSVRDLIVNNYKDTIASVRDIQKLNQPMQSHIQQSILGKVKQINEKVKDGFIRDMVDDVKVTEKVNKSLERIQNTLKDLDIKDLDEKIGSKQFQNDLATLRELNEVYNFVDKDVLDLLDPKSYVDKEVYIAGQLEKGKVELNDSAAKTTEHIKATIEKSKEDFKTQSKELDNSKATQIEEVKAKADQEIDDLKHEHELYKEYQEKAKEVGKTNKEFAKYEKEYGAWKEEVDMVEHVNAERTAKYESDMAEYNNRKAEWEQAEANRIEADNAKANEDFEKAVENRKAQIESEYKRRYSEWEKEKSSYVDNSEAQTKYKEDLHAYNKKVNDEFKAAEKQYKRDSIEYETQAAENKIIADKNLDEQRIYDETLGNLNRQIERVGDFKDLQETINKYPQLYDDLPDYVKEVVEKPIVEGELAKLSDMEELMIAAKLEPEVAKAKEVSRLNKLRDEIKEPEYEPLKDIKKPTLPNRDEIANKYSKDRPVAPEKVEFDKPEPTMKDVEDLIPEPTKNTTEVAKPFQEAEPLAPVMESVSKTEPVKPEGTPVELEPMQKPEPLKKGSDRIRKERVAKESEIKAAHEKNISDLKAESSSTQLAYKEMQDNISEFVKDIGKQKDLVAWLNSDTSLARLEGLDSMAKTLPDGELKLETQRVLDAIYEMADLKDSKLVDRKLANEYLGKALTEVQDKAKLVNKDMIAQKRADIAELKDLYRQMLKDIRTAKKSNPFTIYDEVDIDGYKAKFNELNTKLGGLFKDEKEFLPFRMIDTHKEILANTQKSVDEGVVGKIDRTAQPKALTSDNAQMARLGAVINKQRHLADRAWYEFGNPSGVEGKLLKGQDLDNKYWKIRDVIGDDIKDITEVPEGTAAKIINPNFQERFDKLYDVAKTMFAEVKEGDAYRDINIDEFSVLYFKYLNDLNQTKNVVGKWDGKKLNMGDLKPYFRDTDSMVGFLTLEDLDLQRVGYIKSNNDMLRYFHNGIAKNMAEYNTLGTTLGRFNSLMGLQSKNAKTTFKDALGTAGSDAAKEVHANVLDMAIEKLDIFNNKDPYISTNILNKPAWETAVDGVRNVIMQSILTGVGTMELFTNPVTISKRYSELFGSKFNTYDLATDSIKGAYASRGVYLKHFGKFGAEIYNLAAAVIQPMIHIGKFNQQYIADPNINRIKSGHKYVNAMLSKMQDADMFQRHMDMAKFTANNGGGLQGMGKRVMMAWNEMAFSMQKTPDLQKTLMSGEMAYKGMEDIRDLGGLDALSDSQVQLKNLLFSYGIRNEDDLIKLQTFLKNNSDKDGAIDLDFFDLATLQKNLDAEDMMDLNNAYGIFSSIYNHMDDYRDASKFKPRSHSYVDLMGSFLKNTVMDLGRHELQQTLFTLDDNGLYVNRLKNAWRKGDSTGGRISNIGGTSILNVLNIGGYLALLGTAGTAGLITQELIMKPLKVRETTSRLVGEYDEMIEALDQDGQRELNDYVFGTLFFAMQQGAMQYPAMVFTSGGNFMNDMAGSVYRIIETSIGNTEIENPQVKAALVAMGLDPDSIKYKASGGNYGDFRDYGVYQIGSMFGFRGFRGIIDGVMAIGESSAQKEVRLNKSLSRVQYKFQNSPKAKLAATAFFRDYGKCMSEIGDRINSTNAIIGEAYIKTAQKAGLITEEEANAQMENVIKIEDIENKIEKLPEPVKEVAKGVPEFMGTESPVAKVETQKQIISAVTEGVSRKDVINATTGNKFNEYGVYKSKDPSQLTGVRADMYKDMQKNFDITDKDELLRIICVTNSPKEAYGMIRDKFEVKGNAIPKIERGELLNTSMEFTLGEEGGAHVVNQVENSTWGVTEKVARAHGWYGAMKDIPKDFARMVYKKSYFEPVAKLSSNSAVVTILADTAYNQGLGFAQKIHKQFGDDPKALMQARVDKYNELITKNPAKYGEFMNGWMNRLARLEKFIDSKGGSEQMLAGTTEQSIDGIAMSGMGGTAGYTQPQMEEVDSTMAEIQTPEIEDIKLEDPQYAPKETASTGGDIESIAKEVISSEQPRSELVEQLEQKLQLEKALEDKLKDKKGDYKKEFKAMNVMDEITKMTKTQELLVKNLKSEKSLEKAKSKTVNDIVDLLG